MKTLYLVSLGCSKNRVDSEVLLGMLARGGYEIVDAPEQAEVIVVNTCGFIDSAKRESIDTLFEMNEYRKTGRLQTLVASGCLAQRYRDDLLRDMPELDGILGVSEYARALSAMDAACRGERPALTGDGPRFLPETRLFQGASAYVKISDGCDNRCAYCAIPLIRGAYQSRPMDDILSECAALCESGASELTFIAQDTSRYGNDLPGGKLRMPELLRRASDLPKAHWLRVLYCYPDTCDDALLDAVAGLTKVCSYLDLPLQHINGALLKRMNRRGSPEYIRALIRKCRERNILVRTTMIVGFPGETDEMFEELLDFARETRFERLGAFAYSPEEGTPACDMPDQIPEEVKRERLDRLMTLQQGISREVGRARVGAVCETLVEEKRGAGYAGRSRLEAPETDGKVYFSSKRTLAPGQYVNVRIDNADEYDLYGEEATV